MTQITHDDVLRLAALSSISLSDEEADRLQGDIGRILEYIQQLSELDTEGVEPTYQVTDLQNVWRNDEVDTYGVSEEALLALAPESKDNQIKVPKVL